MFDITHEQSALHTARARAFLLCAGESMAKIESVAERELFATARAAGFLAAKNTALFLPNCFSSGLDGLSLEFQLLSRLDEAAREEMGVPFAPEQAGVLILAQGKSIGRTGVGMQTVAAATVAGLTLYDFFRATDDSLELSGVKLLSERDPRRNARFRTPPGLQAAVLVCADAAASERKKDKAGAVIREMLRGYGVETENHAVVPNETEAIQRQVREWVSQGIAFIFTSGGTGLGDQDKTVGAIQALLDRDAPGIVEAMRAHGQSRTPLAMLSRAMAGSIGKTLVVTLPGSSNGARESLEGILPGVFYARNMLRHDG